jgi:hypothetical protein
VPPFIMNHNPLFNCEARRLFRRLKVGFRKNFSSESSQERRGWICCRCLKFHMAERSKYEICPNCRTVQDSARPCHKCKDFIVYNIEELNYTRWQKRQAEVGWVHESPKCYRYNGDIHSWRCRHCQLDRGHDYSFVVAV